jgi:TPR repeat protein
LLAKPPQNNLYLDDDHEQMQPMTKAIQLERDETIQSVEHHLVSLQDSTGDVQMSLPTDIPELIGVDVSLLQLLMTWSQKQAMPSLRTRGVLLDDADSGLSKLCDNVVGLSAVTLSRNIASWDHKDIRSRAHAKASQHVDDMVEERAKFQRGSSFAVLWVTGIEPSLNSTQLKYSTPDQIWVKRRTRMFQLFKSLTFQIIILLGVTGCDSKQVTNSAPGIVTKRPSPITELSVKAEKGDPDAQTKLGLAYLLAQGVTKDESEAAKWFSKAAHQGEAQAQMRLGVMYTLGLGVAKDEAEAVKWYRKAADQNDVIAQTCLGTMYINGQGVAKDDIEAVKWFRKAAQQGDRVAQSALAVAYNSGRGVAKDDTEAVKWCRKAAEQDDAQMQYELAKKYADGEGVAKDEAEAVAWFRKAAENGHYGAQARLGQSFAYGQGVRQDETEAVKWFRKATENGESSAIYNMGVAYFNGQGVTKDEAEALKWFRKAARNGLPDVGLWNAAFLFAVGQGEPLTQAEELNWFRKAAQKGFYSYSRQPPSEQAEQIIKKLSPTDELRNKAEKGDIDAQINLGRLYVRGEGVPKDEAEAVKWFRKAAYQGNDRGELFLGIMYYNGLGVPKDEAEAVKWYRKAAEQGNADAQYTLGFVYSQGQGVAKDETESLKWHLKAAEQGNADAQCNLGSMYSNGKGAAQNESEAVKWYRKAAEQGNPQGQVLLGFMYENGRGIAKDDAEAVKWYRKAAEQGNVDGQSNLASMYLEGRGITKDEAEAVKWCTKAADQGQTAAQNNLGVMYLQGRGVIKDDVQAYKWFLLAGAKGNNYARNNVAYLEERLEPNQRIEGQRLARGWKQTTNSKAGTKPPTSPIPESMPIASGTAFAITDDGHFITNEHVVAGGSTVRLLTAKGLLPATVVRVDKANDLALLKVDGRFYPLPITPSRSVRLGSTVATVGFPNTELQGFAPKLAKGEIASLSGIRDDARHFQVSVPVQPGNSGGAMVDERGNVVGVIVGKLNQNAALATSGTLAENVNYAVKSSFLLSFLEAIPAVGAKLKEPEGKARRFEDLVEDVERSTALVLVY